MFEIFTKGIKLNHQSGQCMSRKKRFILTFIETWETEDRKVIEQQQQ